MSEEIVRIMRGDNGRAYIEWIDGEPQSVLMDGRLLEDWVADRNAFLDQIDALKTLVEVYKLGRRPNRDQLIAAGTAPSDADLEARRPKL